MNRAYQACARCVLDTNDDPDIRFNAEGVCHYCVSYEKAVARLPGDEQKRKKKLLGLAAEIKKGGEGKKYDCILGVSGGVDSTYLAYLAKQLGLRPLVVHYDNGWNSELAVRNIENIIEKLGFDLYTYVNNWEEFRDLQVSFFKASVLDIELITDQAIVAILYKMARKHGVKYILYGNNVATEGILPEKWYHWKIDVLNIKAIQHRFGKLPLRTYPMVGFWERWWFDKFSTVVSVPLLNYANYNKADAKRIITEELGWRDYGGKHFESIFTRFYQAWYLPEKFGIDKRKAHLSALINSGQITREEALEELTKPTYDPARLQEDKAYVIKKLGFTPESFDAVMKLPPKQHTDYPSYLTRHYKWQQRLSQLVYPLRRLFGLRRHRQQQGELRVLHLTNWYPNKHEPQRALFVREHVNACNRYCRNEVLHAEVLFDGDRFFRAEKIETSAGETSVIAHTNRKNWLISEWMVFWMVLKHLVFSGRYRRYDLINLYIAYPVGIFLRTLRWLTGRPVVITEVWSAYHFDFHTQQRKGGLNRIRRIFFKKAPVVTVSNALGQDIRRFSGNAELDFSVVPNVVDQQIFHPNGTAVSASPRFFMLNVWSVIKNPYVIFEAFAAFIKKHPSARLIVGGYGPEWENMIDAVNRSGIAAHTELKGRMQREEIAEELGKATALLHASSYETFSVICAESICCGTPVAASNVGGIPGFINESNGVLVDEGTPAQWLAAMENILARQDSFDRKKIAEEARRRFSPQEIGRMFMDVFEKALNA